MSAPLPVLDPATFTPSFDALARAAGFRVETFGTIGADSLIACTRRQPGPRPRIYLSAGIHGDEPAPPLALGALLEEGAFDHRATWFLCPLLNPTGLRQGRRENAAGLDLNRDYLSPASPEVRAHVDWLGKQPRFDLVICVHEDWEAQGFYLYELNPDARPSLAPAMLRASGAHCPIETAAVIDGRESAEPGVIRPVSDPLLRATWPEAIYLRQHHSTLVYTIESPSALPLPQRVATLSAAIRGALDEFLA